MKLYNSFLVFVLLCLGSQAFGQSRYFDERAVYTHHFIAPYLVNPGAVGSYDYQQILFNYRNKWAGFDGSPKTVTFAYAGPLGNRLGLGAQLMRDSYGNLETSKGQLSLSYTIDSEINKISFGLSTEYIQHRATGRNFSGTIVDPTDELLLERLDGDNYFDASFGIYGLYNNSLIYGVALPSLISSRLNDEIVTGEDPDRDLGFILNLGYRFTTSDGQIKLEPSMFFKSLMSNVPSHLDLNMKLSFLEDRFTGGVTYTVGADNRLGFLLGTRIDNIGLMYTYNISNRQFQDYNNGSHEMGIMVDIGKNKKKDIMK